MANAFINLMIFVLREFYGRWLNETGGVLTHNDRLYNIKI